MNITITPVAYVKNSRITLEDDFWGSTLSEIVLADNIPDESLDGIESFSHLEILFYFDKADKNKIVTGSSHPRGNPDFPKVGIFCQRKKDRPNSIGSTIVKLVKHQERTIFVNNFDAVDGTPVIDIKPVFKEFLPHEEIIQPEWTIDLMKDYWK